MPFMGFGDPSFTVALLLAFILVLVGMYDIVAVYSDGRWATVSSVVYKAGQDYPLLKIVVGALLYHLFCVRG